MHDNIDRDHDMIMSHFGDTISHAEKIIRDVSSELDPFSQSEYLILLNTIEDSRKLLKTLEDS